MNLFRDIKAVIFGSSKCKFDSNYKNDLKIINEVYESLKKHEGVDNNSWLLWRSVSQYRCQTSIRSKLTNTAANALAFLYLPTFLFLIRAERKKKLSAAVTKYLKIDFHMAYQIPSVIQDDTLERAGGERYLTLQDILFATALFIKNRAWYPELLAKLLLWISSVRPHIDAVKMEYLIQYCEYSAYSSLRKAYLNCNGVKLANVCHGEEFISCRSAFSSFDQYFAWNITPRYIHESMRIEYNELLMFNPCENLPIAPKVTEYQIVGVLWPSIEGDDLDILMLQLNKLSMHFKIIVRPHPNPAYAYLFARYEKLLNAQISNAHHENIHFFIDKCDVVIGHLSAALVQATFRGRRVIYINNVYLKSLQEYHDYYRAVESVELHSLATEVLQLTNSVNKC